MKRIIRLFFIVLIVGGMIGIPVWFYIVKPKIEEYNYVGFMQDKENPEMLVYRTEEHTYLHGSHVIDNNTYYFDKNTYAKHGLMPGEKFFSAGGANQSCAKDLGIAFEKIYNHEVATPELCDEMIEILKTCDDYEELQAGLPADVSFAHKTGCAYALYHDGGIVYLNGREYILVCFSDQASYTRMMPALSAFVYQYQKDLDPLG